MKQLGAGWIQDFMQDGGRSPYEGAEKMLLEKYGI